MFSDVNSQSATGNLVEDCSITPIKNGERLAVSFALISSYSWRTAAGEDQTHAERFNVKCYAGKGLEAILRDRLVKGAKVHISGRTITEKYQTAQGTDAYWRYVLCEPDSIAFLSPRPNTTRQQEAVSAPAQASHAPTNQAAAGSAEPAGSMQWKDLCTF